MAAKKKTTTTKPDPKGFLKAQAKANEPINLQEVTRIVEKALGEEYSLVSAELTRNGRELKLSVARTIQGIWKTRNGGQ